MKFASTLLIGASAMALAMGSAFAADTAKNDPGFNKLDKNGDGYLSRSEAAANPELAKQFKQADRNGDGKLSRAEYLAVMTKKDLNTVKEKVTGKKDANASAGGTKPKQ
jgi:Ca2+-binding EF-hand superfamily protein